MIGTAMVSARVRSPSMVLDTAWKTGPWPEADSSIGPCDPSYRSSRRVVTSETTSSSPRMWATIMAASPSALRNGATRPSDQ